MVLPQLTELLAAGVHLGHKENQWNPKMFPYIYTAQNGIHFLDLVQTYDKLKEASIFCKNESKKNKIFLFVGTKLQASEIVAQEANNCNSFYVNERWLGGTLTNWKTIETRIKRLHALEEQKSSGSLKNLPKKEVSQIKKELEHLKIHFNGIRNMTRIPDIIIIIDQLQELTAVKEAISLKIPIISILDTNCDPNLCNIPIPGNDDSISSIKLILRTLSRNINAGNVTSH